MADIKRSSSMVSSEEDLQHIVNASEMFERPGFLVRRLARRFERITFDLRQVERVHEAARRGRLVYICERQSTLDYLYLNYAFLKLSLPLAYFANGVRTLLYRPILRALGYLLRRLFRRVSVKLTPEDRLAAGVRAGRANLLFLRRRRSIVQWGDRPTVGHLRKLVELQAEIDEPIVLLPVVVFFEKNPERHRRSLLDLVFGVSDAPGRLRKFGGFLRHAKRGFVQVSEPIDLEDYLRQHSDADTPEILADRLLFSLHQGLSEEARPLRGPVLKRSKKICEEIVRADAFRTTLERFAEDTNRPPRSVVKEAAGYLKEIAADFHIRYVEGFCIVLAIVWNRLFSSVHIDMDGLNEIRQAAKKTPIVLVPAHRSHVDYLAISWAFYTHGLIPPHIAAGINLSFWPMGHIFRRSGAFFLRRSFRGNPLYSLTFAAYIRKLVKEGYWIEFFIEGGRSRTGKCLPPRMGMLNYIVDAVFDGAARDIHFVPISIGYERVVEEGAYSRELGGAEKQAENLTGLLRSTKVLRARYGQMNMHFDTPISLQSYAEEQGFSVEGSSADDRHAFVTRFAHELIAGINRATVISTTSIVATSLLCHPKRGISLKNLYMRVGRLLDIAARQGAPLAPTLRIGLQARRIDIARAEEEAARPPIEGEPQTPRYQRQRIIDRARGAAVREALDGVLKHLIAHKLVQVDRFEDEDVYTPVEDRRINLDIYKNAFIHLLVPHAIAATAILAAERDGEIALSEVRRHVWFLLRLMKFEFIYRDRKGFDEAFVETRDELIDLGLIELTSDVAAGDGQDFAGPGGVDGARVHPKAHHLLRFFRNVTANFLESYWLTARRLPELLESPMTPKDVAKRLQSEARRSFREGDLLRREAVSAVNFRNAISFFRERGFLGKDDKGRLTLLRSAALFERWAEHIRMLLGKAE